MSCFIFFSIRRSPPTSTLFPYTTLFRSYVRLVTRLGPLGDLVEFNISSPNTRLVYEWSRKPRELVAARTDRKSTRLNSSHTVISYAVFCLKKKKKGQRQSGIAAASIFRI